MRRDVVRLRCGRIAVRTLCGRADYLPLYFVRRRTAARSEGRRSCFVLWAGTPLAAAAGAESEYLQPIAPMQLFRAGVRPLCVAQADCLCDVRAHRDIWHPRTDVRLGPDSYRPLAPEARRPGRISAGPHGARSAIGLQCVRTRRTARNVRTGRPCGARSIPDLRPADRRIFPAAMRRKREKARAPEDYASRAAPTKSSRAPAAASGSSRKPM